MKKLKDQERRKDNENQWQQTGKKDVETQEKQGRGWEKRCDITLGEGEKQISNLASVPWVCWVSEHPSAPFQGEGTHEAWQLWCHPPGSGGGGTGCAGMFAGRATIWCFRR